MTCRPCLASGASLACSRARTPRSRSCGRRSVGTGKAAHVGRPAGYPAALAGQQAGRYRAVRGLSRCSQLGWRWQRAHSGGCGVRFSGCRYPLPSSKKSLQCQAVPAFSCCRPLPSSTTIQRPFVGATDSAFEIAQLEIRRLIGRDCQIRVMFL